MSDLETTQAKLRASPTAGVEAEHSALYRRYFSSGYKGYIQGTIAGGTFYGALGLAIGAVVGVPLMFFAAASAAPAIAAAAPLALLLAPVLGTGFALYGAHAFSGIGTNAAIMADSDEHMEKRRTLLDRLAATQNPAEAQEISSQLARDEKPKPIEEHFHWRPALIGAALGIALAVIAVTIPFAAPEFFSTALPFIATHFGLTLGGMITAGAALGGLSGSVIGIDRGIVRGWLDGTEALVHDNNNQRQGLIERERDIQRLNEAAHTPTASTSYPATRAIPGTQISQPSYADRVVSANQAIAL